jgi:hypothetical protein
MSFSGFRLAGAWSNLGQPVEQIAESLTRTMHDISAACPVGFTWHEVGSTTPLLYESVDETVRKSVWRHGVTSDPEPAKGYVVDLVGWKDGLSAGKWEPVVSLRVSAGMSVLSRGVPLWPNSVTVDIGSAVPEGSILAFGHQVISMLVENWPAQWALFENFPARRAALGRVLQPSTMAGLATWISDEFARVPRSVPHCSVAHVTGGTMITVDDREAALSNPSILREVNEFLTGSGSLPNMPV